MNKALAEAPQALAKLKALLSDYAHDPRHHRDLALATLNPVYFVQAVAPAAKLYGRSLTGRSPPPKRKREVKRGRVHRRNNGIEIAKEQAQTAA